MIYRGVVSDAATFRRMEPAGASDIDGQAKGRVSGSERVKRPTVSALDVGRSTFDVFPQ